MSANERFVIDAEPRQPGYVASYLRVAGDECAFIECYTEHALPELLAALAAHGLAPEQVRYLVVTHAHLDHAGGASALMKACPNATLLAHPRAARHLIDPSRLVSSATAVYGEQKFRETYGTIQPIAEERVRALGDGESFELGGRQFDVMFTLGHAKHHFVVRDPSLSTVYTGDAFGLVYPALQRGRRLAIPSTSPTDFDPGEAQASIERIVALGCGSACLTHFGEVRELRAVADQLLGLLAQSARFLDEARGRESATVEELSAQIKAQLRQAIGQLAEKSGAALSDAEWQLLELDLQLNADGIAFVAKRPH